MPALFAGSGARVAVGGRTSQDVDYFNAVTRPTPYVLAFVLGLSFLVLLFAFRSLVVALVSIALNLLSVGAAYGLLTLVFVHGVGAGLFGFQQAPFIEAWVPLFLFSVLFGLSMDYQVFLMSRIKERHDAGEPDRRRGRRGRRLDRSDHHRRGADHRRRVCGLRRAASSCKFQQMGFGVAVALLLDATVIRSVVLPSLLKLLGERTWYLPRWLSWLPRFDLESGSASRSPSARPTSRATSPA